MKRLKEKEVELQSRWKYDCFQFLINDKDRIFQKKPKLFSQTNTQPPIYQRWRVRRQKQKQIFQSGKFKRNLFWQNKQRPNPKQNIKTIDEDLLWIFPQVFSKVFQKVQICAKIWTFLFYSFACLPNETSISFSP